MIKEGSRVLIVAVLTQQVGASIAEQTRKYIGHTGTIARDDGDKFSYQYLVKFDDEKLEEQNIKEGRWLWSKNELIELDNDNDNFVR